MINTELLIKGAEELGLKMSERQTDSFVRLAEELIGANKKFNLTAITDEYRIVTEHFLDSLTVLKAGCGKKILDVGTGGGFPGLPAAIMCPDTECVLMDSTAKKLKYIDETAELLGLKNVSTVTARAEEAAHRIDMREQFDIVYARAVSDMRILCELCLPFVKKNGIFAAQKSAGSEKEIMLSAKKIALLGGRIKEIIAFNIPTTDIPRSLVIIEKTKPTPALYPREYNKIKKDASK